MSRPKTKEEIRQEFLEHIKGLVKYWDELPQKTTTDRLDGLAFSILSTIDGCSISICALNIVVRPHPDDKQFNIDNGDDYYPDGLVINDDVYLHDLWVNL